MVRGADILDRTGAGVKMLHAEFGVAHPCLAGVGQAHAFSASVKQLNTQQSFELLDLL